MARVCENCGNEYGVMEGITLCDGNIVCDKCCQSIIDRNGEFKSKVNNFRRNLSVINLEEFKTMYTSPELAMKCDTNEQLLTSPFRREYSKHEFYFLKKQLWLSYVKKRIETTVLVYNEGLDITEVTTTVSTKVKNYFLSMDNILECKSRIKMLILPLVLIAFVFIFYRIDIWAILISLLLLWWSYGREIILKTKNGDTYKIPVNSKTEEIEQLITIVKETQANGTINCEEKNGAFESLNAEMNSNMKPLFCKHCGTASTEGAQFCANCGNKL